MNDTPKPRSQAELLEELRKRQEMAHTMWLNDPTTKQFIEFLKKRGTQYEEQLFSSVLKETNSEFQATHRGAITTCGAILKVATDFLSFQQHAIKQPESKQQ
jgi:hypothetical protein